MRASASARRTRSAPIKRRLAPPADLAKLASAPPAGPLPLRIAYRAGLSQEPMFFVVDRRPMAEDLARAAQECGAGGAIADGAARVVDATHNNYPEDTGRWRVAGVY